MIMSIYPREHACNSPPKAYDSWTEIVAATTRDPSRTFGLIRINERPGTIIQPGKLGGTADARPSKSTTLS